LECRQRARREGEPQIACRSIHSRLRLFHGGCWSTGHPRFRPYHDDLHRGNIRETDLTYVKEGNPARITIDAYPDSSHRRQGNDAARQAVRFALLPPPNPLATGVKVVQRIPSPFLRSGTGPSRARAGMSVKISIDTGHQRSLGELCATITAIFGPDMARGRGSGVINRAMITATVMFATLMQALDITIANVALPYMQGSLSATSDQINWVADLLYRGVRDHHAGKPAGSKRGSAQAVIPDGVIGFVVTSMLCGAAVSLGQIVVFRLLQGISARRSCRSRNPCCLTPIRRSSRAGDGGVRAWRDARTDSRSDARRVAHGFLHWRWVFYVNVPFGALCAVGVLLFLGRRAEKPWLDGSTGWLRDTRTRHWGTAALP